MDKCQLAWQNWKSKILNQQWGKLWNNPVHTVDSQKAKNSTPPRVGAPEGCYDETNWFKDIWEALYSVYLILTSCCWVTAPPPVQQNARDLLSEESKARSFWTEGNTHTEESGDTSLQTGEFSKLHMMTAEVSQVNSFIGSQDKGTPVITLQARGCMNFLWGISSA